MNILQSIIDKSLIINMTGMPLFLDIIEDSICNIDIGEIFLNFVNIPIHHKWNVYAIFLTIDPEFYQGESGHAIAMIINNRDKSYMIFDSSYELGLKYHLIIDDYMEKRGFHSKSIFCRRRFLPLQLDNLCILWALFTIFLECNNQNIHTLNSKDRDLMFQTFIDHVWILAIQKGYIRSYYRLLQFILNKFANLLVDPNMKFFDGRFLLKSYRLSIDKDKYLDRLDWNFDARPNLVLTLTDLTRLSLMINYAITDNNVLHYLKLRFFRGMMNSRNMDDLIDIFNRIFYPYEAPEKIGMPNILDLFLLHFIIEGFESLEDIST